jgi:DNA-binding GntR family transcriptional regulator
MCYETFMDSQTDTPTKQQVVYRSLREQLLAGTLVPGERLVIDRIAESHNVSAIPVREALSQLEREGLVEIRPHAGAVVTDIPASAIKEIFALLEAFETVSCRLGISRLSVKDIAFLRDLAAKMEKTKDPETWLNLNRLFHESVPRLARLPRLEEQMVRVGESWERLRRLRFSDHKGEDKARADRQHLLLVRALEHGDEEAALEVIRKHNREALEQYTRD